MRLVVAIAFRLDLDVKKAIRQAPDGFRCLARVVVDRL
jgi:hypothetical protein